MQKQLYLGNLDAKRDWGYARDYVEAMWLMLQQDEPDDYVIATGETHSVREFLGAGVPLPRARLARTTSSSIRAISGPSEVDLLLGDASKARERLGWYPRTSFAELVRLMVDFDWALAANSAFWKCATRRSVRESCRAPLAVSRDTAGLPTAPRSKISYVVSLWCL